ncbi:TRAP transporter large permease [Amorphus orientalis]|uniref:TRAP transporter large permease protein n=1 Tax=Amorphus orientalis TaxID=649198 RepID=A0AAE3VKB5_9HYPH|nr:TRAP transporter large permease [Amorphus orientalis]MDQ0313610.1 tripartite ATP-independent transporter DctM subunit [Amorphus orientalis]
MSPELAGPIGFVAVILLIAVRVPIALAMALVGVVGSILLGGWSSATYVLSNLPYEAIANDGMEVVPLFIFMGVFATYSGLSKNLYAGVQALIGHWRGGIAMATVGASAGFGAICGSSLATAATIGRVAMPEMRSRNYADSLAAASVAAGGTLGVLIPPSIILILYAIMTGESIGALFAAALIPGLIGTVLYMAAVKVQVMRKPELGPAGTRFTFREKLVALSRVWDALLLIGLVIGGIYGRIFSPTEAAAVGAGGALLITALRGKLTGAILVKGLAETASMTGMIFLILIGASLFNYFIELSNLTGVLTDAIQASGLPPLGIVLLVIVFYVILGCFMDALSMVLLTVVPLYQLATGIGFDGVWFGVLVVTVAEIGLITPPIGMNLFVIQAVTPNLSIGTVIKGILPFITADIVRVGILVAFPAVVLYLPRLFGF